MFRKLFVVAFAAAFAAAPLPVLAQGKKDSVVMGMTLEPPGSIPPTPPPRRLPKSPSTTSMRR
ncbi:hypothetical protein AB8Z38_10800 [Bradyrhizobium sp. LLZ17]|uniref:Uncharacterized protein n=1 Tax=Bradyrhizobium sp. LLZ17 TaxID=3239388 RepID=A0AB39XRK3_9BRAD